MTKLGFLRGALLGLLAGLLVAPRSGKETRENIKKHYEEISDRIAEELSCMKDVTQETYTQVVGAVVHGFVEAKKITADEAAEIKIELKKGFDDIRESHKKELEAKKSKA
ncbi:MAG TPA: YtxH domain-containing protein [Acidobacteriota bacterium]|nr:YtxH domain-containing protein [Acidobacteriota bacterium]